MSEQDTSALEREALRSILGDSAASDSSVVDPIEVYDHELDALIAEEAAVVDQWGEALATCPPSAWEKTITRFEKEVQERFSEIGFIAKVVMVPEPDLGGMLCPTINITGRVEAIDFDPERQVHEVTHDVLGLGEEHSSVIDTKRMSPEQMAEARHHHDEGW